MSAKQIIKDNQDKLLQILLYKEYQEYVKNTHIDNTYPDDYEFKGNKKYIVLDFEEWLEEILENF